MLPNWLYGKSKSKLASILGGGGGIPEDYNQVKAQVTQNAEDILLLSDALDEKAALTQITNPNILHNPWFQVNQRGLASISTNGYFLDRWRVLCATSGATTYTLNSDGTITIDNSLGETQAYFIQRRTAKTISRIVGRIITASVMLSDGAVRSGTGTYVDTETQNYYEDGDIKIQSIAQYNGQFFVLRVEAGKTLTIKALKLELGSVSTLAMDTAPDMAVELAKCQRYYQEYWADGNYPFALGLAISSTEVRIPFKLTNPMRTTPTFSLSSINDIAVTTSTLSAAITPTAVVLQNALPSNPALVVTGSGFTVGATYAICSASGKVAKLAFDAEL